MTACMRIHSKSNREILHTSRHIFSARVNSISREHQSRGLLRSDGCHSANEGPCRKPREALHSEPGAAASIAKLCVGEPMVFASRGFQNCCKDFQVLAPSVLRAWHLRSACLTDMRPTTRTGYSVPISRLRLPWHDGLHIKTIPRTHANDCWV